MNALMFPLASIDELGLSIDTTVPGEQLRPSEVTDFEVGPVTVRGTLSPSGHEYIFFGAVSGTFTAPCDRCLETTEQPFESEVTWTFVHGTPLTDNPAEDALGEDEEVFDDLDDDSVIPFDGQTINLMPTVWEEVVLAVPAKVLCKEDCAGLCPRCGQDLNQGRCGCKPDAEDTSLSNKGLAGLKDLLPKLQPDRPEE